MEKFLFIILDRQGWIGCIKMERKIKISDKRLKFKGIINAYKYLKQCIRVCDAIFISVFTKFIQKLTKTLFNNSENKFLVKC